MNAAQRKATDGLSLAMAQTYKAGLELASDRDNQQWLELKRFDIVIFSVDK